MPFTALTMQGSRMLSHRRWLSPTRCALQQSGLPQQQETEEKNTSLEGIWLLFGGLTSEEWFINTSRARQCEIGIEEEMAAQRVRR